MVLSQDNQNEHLLSAVRAEFESGRIKSSRPELAADFASIFLSRVPAQDLEDRSPYELAALCVSLLAFAESRVPGTALVRVYNPVQDTHAWESRYSIVEIVHDDMPFLVDSVAMAVAKHQCTVHLTIHPTLDVSRDSEDRLTSVAPRGTSSEACTELFLYLEIDRQTSDRALRQIRSSIQKSLADVRLAVRDWKAMRDTAFQVSREIGQAGAPVGAERLAETRDLIDWMARDHFTFLGYRCYDLKQEKEGLWLCPIPGSGLGILDPSRSNEKPREVSVSARSLVERPEPVIFTKTNARATVHRTGYLDYVGVMRFDENGRIIGEHRFLGLFTSSAYSRVPRDIPLLRLKVRNVVKRSGLSPTGHGGKALIHILDTLPRDELFQGSEDELLNLSISILNLQERRQTRLFIRRERFGRFYSCLVYIPRDRFNTEVREQIQDILKRSLNGVRVDYTVQVFDTPLARVHVLIRTRSDERINIDVDAIEKRLVEVVRSWQEQLEDILAAKVGEQRADELVRRFGRAFPAAYTEDVTPWVASFDVLNLAELEKPEDLRMSLYRPRKRRGGFLRFKLFRLREPIPLSDSLPMLENMGLRIVNERPYELVTSDSQTMWIQDFDMIPVVGGDLNLDQVKQIFQDTFLRVWLGEVENDGFNRLVLGARLDWRQVAVIRGCCKYLLQIGIPFSQPYMEQTLAACPEVAKLLMELFEARLNPSRQRGRDERVAGVREALTAELERVQSLDFDRILRAFIGFVDAILRTNFYQRGTDAELKPTISFKLETRSIPGLPEPRPMYEVFVYGPHMEGVHLRGGKVARGGIRWSDRREDFRTEVLGLMKAQMVKNTVIVPVGAKGGFVLKRSPVTGGREALQQEGIRCYRHFIRGLLDLTDNIVDTKVVRPENVVCHDDDDPYLVVAADKGTATFSDIANEISREYGFWLGDAFASGGSVGYDHKKMGITARGAWESVKRHFRELGHDIQHQPFSVVGIGDMSGDVFGNGMLLSRCIRLKAAFNHLHIFIDPDPDPERSLQERERLFALERSSWDNYDRKLISAGGGVWPRQQKRIPISPQVRKWLEIDARELSPNELIRALLGAPADLLWNGGIGTYVKAAHESNADVGDHANDPVRVNGRDLRCKVVGEGGNLGLTQLGRIEYAAQGGRLNTDFIDNSAGVDCSDHEVNIKILLNDVEQFKPQRLRSPGRTELLSSMQEEVAHLVLRNNYLQTQAISLVESQTKTRLGEHADFITILERQGVLNRELEHLPDTDTIKERRLAGLGLTSPELAILLCYAKMHIYADLLASDVPEDQYLSKELLRYFPKILQRDFHDLMPRHGLRREIIATQITNSVVNRMGITFVHRMMRDTGADSGGVARAYTIAREVYDARTLWTAIESLDNRVASSLQMNLILEIWQMLRHVTRWLLNRRGLSLEIAAAVERYRPGIKRLVEILPDLFADDRHEYIERESARLTEAGVTTQLASHMACVRFLYPGPDIVEISLDQSVPVDRVAQVYLDVSKYLNLKWLRQAVEQLPVDSHWHAQARSVLRDQLYGKHRFVTAHVLAEGDIRDTAIVDTWMSGKQDTVQPILRMFRDIRNSGESDFATITIAVRSLDSLLKTLN